MKRLMMVAVAALLAAPSLAFADGIEGKWKTDSGATAEIASCGKAFCITLRDGEHKGKRIGRRQEDVSWWQISRFNLPAQPTGLGMVPAAVFNSSRHNVRGDG